MANRLLERCDADIVLTTRMENISRERIAAGAIYAALAAGQFQRWSRAQNIGPEQVRRSSKKSARRPLVILELDGLKAGSWRDGGAPYPHVVALAYRDGRPPLSWLVANQRYWADSYLCDSCVVGGAPDGVDVGCLNAVEGLGLCPARAAARIRQATENYWVLSSNGWDAAAWLGELLKAGGMGALSFEVVDLFNWSQRLNDRQVRRHGGPSNEIGTSGEDQVASCAVLVLRATPAHSHPGPLATAAVARAGTATGGEDF